MVTYVALMQFTEQGARNIKEAPARRIAYRQFSESIGVHVKAVYTVMGQYDMVAIIEAQDEAAMAKWLLTAATKGNVRTETLRAFTDEEFGRILAELP